MNGDSKPDLVTTNQGSSNISILRNTYLPPLISSVSPASAKPGDVVTLTGSGFNSTAANNIVFFGATRATVTTASATSLTVTVPIGATYSPITLLNAGTTLSCASTSNFHPVYAPAKSNITTSDFLSKVDIGTGVNSWSQAIDDIDDEVQPSLIIAILNTYVISI